MPVSKVFVRLKPSGPVIPKVTDVPEGKPSMVYESDPISRTKLALTLEAALMVTVQVRAVPLQAPLQPPKLEFVSAVAVSVTLLPCANEALHVVPQLMPAGLLETPPVPVPVFVILSAKLAGAPVLKV